jgi:NADH-quinone oxidoreductase subunit G
MAKIIIDGQEIACRDGHSRVAGGARGRSEHPALLLSPGPFGRGELPALSDGDEAAASEDAGAVWAPKLFPSCQTPVKDGMEVRFESDAVRDNQKHVMEYYLLNHPLDCPVCDKAGECYLQDYSEGFGPASSRMVDEKLKNPKKDIGPHTLLYQDRCVLCTRCVRFCDEVAGGGELRVINRGSRGEIDVFPGQPLANPLQGNVVDLCPVGALLDKDFLFKQRVWMLKATPSISPADSQGQAIWIDHNAEGVHRIRPRHNEKVNQWWISDEARFGFAHHHHPGRLRVPQVRGEGGLQPTQWEALPQMLRARLAELAKDDAGARIAAVISPMLSCEEAWLLARFVRDVAPQATLAVGHVPVVGEDQTFPGGFTIKAEKCPNRRGVETILDHLGGNRATFDEILGRAVEGELAAAYVTGAYPDTWITEKSAKALAKVDFLVVHDLLSSLLDASANVQIPAATWIEREGTFMNCDGLLQPFERALPPLEGVKADGQLFFELAGGTGLFRAQRVRESMAAEMPAFAEVFIPRKEPAHAH